MLFRSPDFASDFCSAGVCDSPGSGSSGGVSEGRTSDSPDAAAGEIGGDSTGETPVAEVRSKAGCSIAGSDFDRQLSNFRPLDSGEGKVAHRKGGSIEKETRSPLNTGRNPGTGTDTGPRKLLGLH